MQTRLFIRRLPRLAPLLTSALLVASMGCSSKSTNADDVSCHSPQLKECLKPNGTGCLCAKQCTPQDVTFDGCPSGQVCVADGYDYFNDLSIGGGGLGWHSLADSGYGLCATAADYCATAARAGTTPKLDCKSGSGGSPQDAGGAGRPSPGTYGLSPECTKLLAAVPDGWFTSANCTKDSATFHLPDTSTLQNDPHADVCGVSDGDVAMAVNYCYAAACDGGLGITTQASSYDQQAKQQLQNAADLCASSSQSLATVGCAFVSVWSCP
jgi:hypothetical protein